MRALVAVVLIAVVPSACAHGALEARELEIEILADESTELVSATGGFDITQVFLGEAHDAKVGAGPAGDGVYFRATLAGRPGADGDARVLFVFEGPAGAVERAITVSGQTIASDFDALAALLTDDGLEIERAFVAYASAGLAPGDRLAGFRVVTTSGSRTVDVAPGGLYAGPLEAPAGESRVVAEEIQLAGVGRYLDVGARIEGEDVVLAVTSLLRNGSQHLELALEGADVVVEGPASVSVGPAGTAEFRIRANGRAPVDVTSDVGGRDRVVIDDDGGLRVLADDGATVLAAADPSFEERVVPVTSPMGLFAALAVALLARRA